MDDELPADIAARIRRRGGAATIYDIAELAGVNPSTVSRALSKPGRVSQKTEARIRAAADRLDFHFNPMARALPTGRSHTIGLGEGVSGVLPDVESGVRDLVDHLADLGHESIAYLSGPVSSWISQRRWEVMLDAAESRGIALVEIGPLSPTIEGGREALRRVLASRTSAVMPVTPSSRSGRGSRQPPLWKTPASKTSGVWRGS